MDYLTNMFPCVTFVPAEPESPNYVTIYPGTECKSELGMRGGNQAMYLNSACFDRGLIVPVHELLHTLGFVHEHNRTLVLAGSWSVHKLFCKPVSGVLVSNSRLTEKHDGQNDDSRQAH